jgi:hypothetical protein
MARYIVKDDAPPLEANKKVRASRSRQSSNVYVNLWNLDVGWSSRVYSIQHLNQCYRFIRTDPKLLAGSGSGFGKNNS